MRSRDHRCSTTSVSTKYYECACILAPLQCRILLSPAACLPLLYSCTFTVPYRTVTWGLSASTVFLHISHKWHDFRGKNRHTCSDFLFNFRLQNFSFEEEFSQTLSQMYIGLHTKYPLFLSDFNPLNPELNPICYLLALLGAHNFLHVSRIRVKLLTIRLLMSYIYIWSTHSWCF